METERYGVAYITCIHDGVWGIIHQWIFRLTCYFVAVACCVHETKCLDALDIPNLRKSFKIKH